MDSDGEQGDADPSQLTESFTLPEGGPAGPISTAEEKDPPQESPNPKPKDGSVLIKLGFLFVHVNNYNATANGIPLIL